MFPSFLLNKIKPIYTEVEGWKEDISQCRNYNDLPEKAKRYIDFLEESVGIKISMISVGPDRENTIKR